MPTFGYPDTSEKFQDSLDLLEVIIQKYYESHQIILKMKKINVCHVHTLRSVFVNSSPPKPEVILTNSFAEPTVLLVPITSRVKRRREDTFLFCPK
jgi:hypothetical protein